MLGVVVFGLAKMPFTAERMTLLGDLLCHGFDFSKILAVKAKNLVAVMLSTENVLRIAAAENRQHTHQQGEKEEQMRRQEALQFASKTHLPQSLFSMLQSSFTSFGAVGLLFSDGVAFVVFSAAFSTLQAKPELLVLVTIAVVVPFLGRHFMLQLSCGHCCTGEGCLVGAGMQSVIVFTPTLEPFCVDSIEPHHKVARVG